MNGNLTVCIYKVSSKEPYYSIMIKKIVLLFALFLCVQTHANMANPVRRGTLGGRPFVNEFVAVVHEDLYIKIDENFKNAFFNIKYHIEASKDGFQIPFLFYASEYLDSFTVKIDGKTILVKDIPDAYKVSENRKFKDFSYFFENHSNTNQDTELLKNSYAGFYISLNDMLYFETDISKGKHVIEVNYNAAQWIDNKDWIKEYSFRYALSPAKYWKSFGTLSINIDATDFNGTFTTNLGKPKTKTNNSISKWEFNKLPTDVFQIIYKPKVSWLAQLLIRITPLGLALLTALILILIHFSLVKKYREKNPSKKYSLFVIIGSLLVPLAFLISWVLYYSLIDFFIGEHAGRFHGYIFLTLFFLYPIILPIYWFIFWRIDKKLKNK